MWATYDTDRFPLVFVSFKNNIKTDVEFELFLSEWINLYNNKKEFTFIFDTNNVGSVHIKYCIKMALFIKRLKKRQNQYLQKSIILVKNKYIMTLLDLIFYIQSPVAPVFIINDNYKEDYLQLSGETIQNIENNMDKKIKYINPGKSLIYGL